MSTRPLIEALNSLNIGDLESMARKVGETRAAAAAAGLSEIACTLDEAQAALDRADFKTFRKKIQHAVSRLGHAKTALSPAPGNSR